MSKNELSNPNSFTALQGFNLADAMSEEMVGMDVSFDRIKIPAGGSTVFEVPGRADEVARADSRLACLRRS